MHIDVITKEDLQEFRLQIIEDIKNLLVPENNLKQQEWLKTADVKKLLNVSYATLQTLRINGKLPFTKVGGTIYYKADDLGNILNKKSL